MPHDQIQIGERVVVVSDGPFRGKKGIIKGGDLQGDRYDWLSLLLDTEEEPMAFMPKELVVVRP